MFRNIRYIHMFINLHLFIYKQFANIKHGYKMLLAKCLETCEYFFKMTNFIYLNIKFRNFPSKGTNN